MLEMVKMGLRRSIKIFFLLGFLYILLNLQLSLFLYFYYSGFQEKLFYTGYLIGLGGFLAGIAGLHFAIISKYTYEFGNLETIGFSRFFCIRHYLIQYLIVLGVTLFPSVIVFQILYHFIGSVSLSGLDLAIIHLESFFALFLFHGLTILSSLWIHTRKEPFLLIRERL